MSISKLQNNKNALLLKKVHKKLKESHKYLLTQMILKLILFKKILCLKK